MKKIWILIIALYTVSAQAIPVAVTDTNKNKIILDGKEYFSQKTWDDIISNAHGAPINITELIEVGHTAKYYFLTDPLDSYDVQKKNRYSIPGTDFYRNIATTKRYKLIPKFPRPYLISTHTV
ncbi:MAG TPA: hypothetical protein QGF02_03710 [Candidatus Babeliales bacterium]|nr:hypothetical protein [Candidatus Babeliales bacterium]